jgi:hypothetical protein
VPGRSALDTLMRVEGQHWAIEMRSRLQKPILCLSGFASRRIFNIADPSHRKLKRSKVA